MFEVAEKFLIQLYQLIPSLVALYVMFDLTGGLLFGKK